MPAPIVIADSITRVGPEAAGAVVVNASHGGVYAAYLAANSMLPRRSSTTPGLAATALGSAGSITWKTSASPPRPSVMTRRGSVTAPT